MRCTAAGEVLFGPEPLIAAGGVPTEGLCVIARLDGATLKTVVLWSKHHVSTSGPMRLNHEFRKYIHSNLTVRCGCSANVFLFHACHSGVESLFLFLFAFSCLIWLPARTRPIPVIRGGGGIRAPMSARVWGREPW